MAGGVRKLGTSMVEISADIAPLEARLAEAKRLVEQYEMDVEAAKAQANMSDEDRYQATLQRFAVEAEQKRRAIAMEQEHADAIRRSASQVATATKEVEQKGAAGFAAADGFTDRIKNATAPARGFITALSGVVRILGVAGVAIGAAGLAFGKLRDFIFGSRREIEAYNARIAETNKLHAEFTKIAERLRGEARTALGLEFFGEDTDRSELIAQIRSIQEEIQKLEERRDGGRFTGVGLLSTLIFGGREKRIQDEIREEMAGLEKALSSAGAAASAALDRTAAQGEAFVRNQRAAYQEMMAERVAALKDVEESEKRISRMVEDSLRAISDKPRYIEEAKRAAVDAVKARAEADAELAAQEKADAAVAHAARMDNIAREHEAMMRAIEEYKAKIVGANTAFGGIRNLEAIPGILEKLVNRI
jgi:hypothetical protein